VADCWQVLDSIDQIEPSEWNAVVRAAGGSVFHSHEWLSAYEHAPPAPLFNVRHVLLRRAGRLLLVAPMYEVAEDPHYTGYGPDYGFDHPILRARMLVGHSWYSYFNGICTLADAASVAAPLTATMAGIARDLDSPIYGFPGVPEGDALGPELAATGFVPVYTEATSGVDFAGTAAAHVQSMRGSKRQREFRRLSERAARLGAEIRRDVRDGDVAAFAELVADVCARHGVPPVNPASSLHRIFADLSEQAHFVSVWNGDLLLGGFVLLYFDGVLYAWIAGLNYEHHKEFGTYYCLYAQTLLLGEQLGARRIEMGRSMYGFKTRMGFHPQLLVSWLKAGNAAGTQLLRTGVPALATACRTRHRVAQAYRDNGLEVPAPIAAPARYRTPGGAGESTPASADR
jgi:hypothetical protein